MTAVDLNHLSGAIARGFTHDGHNWVEGNEIPFDGYGKAAILTCMASVANIRTLLAPSEIMPVWGLLAGFLSFAGLDERTQ